VLPVPDKPWKLGRWWPAVALVALALAVTTLFLERRPDQPPATTTEEAIAVAEAPDAPPAQLPPAQLPPAQLPPAPVPPATVKPTPGRKSDPVPARRRPETRPPPTVPRRPDTASRPPAGPQEPGRLARDTSAASTETPVPAMAAAIPLPQVPAALPAPEETPAVTAVPEARDEQPIPFSRLKVRRYVEPRYPRNALTRRVSGWVEVGFTVDASGRTQDVRVLNAEPPGMFDDAAVAAVNRWRFEPVDGVDPPFDSEIRLRFQP